MSQFSSQPGSIGCLCNILLAVVLLFCVAGGGSERVWPFGLGGSAAKFEYVRAPEASMPSPKPPPVSPPRPSAPPRDMPPGPPRPPVTNTDPAGIGL